MSEAKFVILNDEKIPYHRVPEVFQHAKTVDLKTYIEQFHGVVWQTKGNSIKCRCPLHKEKTPSFTIRQGEGGVWTFNCFGCSRSGTIIDFVMEVNGFDRPLEALKIIAEKTGISRGYSDITSRMVTPKVERPVEELEQTHYMSSINAGDILRDKFENAEVREWVKNIFLKLDTALDKNDLEGIKDIDSEINQKIRELV